VIRRASPGRTEVSVIVRVLYVSEIQWLSQVSRKHLLVRRLPAEWEVLFVSPMNARARENSVLTRRDPARPTLRYRSLPLPKPDSGSAALRSLTPALALLGHWLLAGVVRRFRPDVVVCSYIWAAPLAEELVNRAVPVVYDLNDLHPEFYPARREEASGMFRRLVTAATEVVASSQRLREAAGRGVVIGNGVDLDTFTGTSDFPVPDPIARSPLSARRNLVAYVGSVDNRLDFAILERVLERLAHAPDGAGLVVVGRVFDSVADRRRAIEKRFPETVLFTGRVSYSELPAYLARASVGIAPFVQSARTEAINPNKLYMYAAMNENVVSTPFSREIEEYRDVLYLASDPDGFADAVMAALRDDTRRRVVRQRIAVPNSWDGKAAEFTRLLASLGTAAGASSRS